MTELDMFERWAKTQAQLKTGLWYDYGPGGIEFADDSTELAWQARASLVPDSPAKEE